MGYQRRVHGEADLDKKVIEWTKQIEEWKKSALASLKSKISCLYPKSYCGVAPTPLKLKSTERDVKLKPSFGLSHRPLLLPAKLLLLKIRSSTELAAGIPQLRLT